MREIKFRAWDGQKMLFDCIIKNGKYVEYSENDDFYTFAEFDYPLMQYTGLKDKNGKEIYEGDIIQFKRNNEEFRRKEIQWINHYGQWNFPHLNNNESNYKKDITPKDILDSSWEVIGNIYENPELLT